MDDIPVRQLRFEFADAADPVWSRSSPDFAIFINALGIHVPHFERFLVHVMRPIGMSWRTLSCGPTCRPSSVRNPIMRSTF